jgi:anti-sigma28 factor (negative regulator of flagellin synthesis)
MKIDSTASNFDPAVKSERTDSAKRAETTTAGRIAAEKQTDAVRLSPEVQLAARAIAAANQPDASRADVVERAKKLLASGELGKDAGRLADAILDRTIATNDQD